MDGGGNGANDVCHESRWRGRGVRPVERCAFLKKVDRIYDTRIHLKDSARDGGKSGAGGVLLACSLGVAIDFLLTSY